MEFFRSGKIEHFYREWGNRSSQARGMYLEGLANEVRRGKWSLEDIGLMFDSIAAVLK